MEGIQKITIGLTIQDLNYYIGLTSWRLMVRYNEQLICARESVKGRGMNSITGEKHRKKLLPLNGPLRCQNVHILHVWLYGQDGSEQAF